MNEDKRAADDVITIYARIQEIRRPKPIRRGTPMVHCGHCPLELEEMCHLTCCDQAKLQGWFIADDTW